MPNEALLRLPWRLLLGLAVVELRWSPDVFWAATPQELMAALAYLDDKHAQKKNGLTSQDVASLKSLLEGNAP